MTEEAAAAKKEANFEALQDESELVVEGRLVTNHPPFVDVVAPADMPEGYQFSVDVNGEHYVVAVPVGGVKKDQNFRAAVVQAGFAAEDGGHRVPHGRWRDGLFECFKHGCCHPQCCLTFWAEPLALGQILTRMKLNWLGSPLPNSSYNHPEGQPKSGMSAFQIMFIIFLAYQFLDYFLGFLLADFKATYDSDAGEYVSPKYVPLWAKIVDAFRQAMALAYAILLLVVTIRARAAVRARYSIPEEQCQGCEDVCCSVFCSPCTVCQMGRHTADYGTYAASCCSDTGLTATAPQVV